MEAHARSPYVLPSFAFAGAGTVGGRRCFYQPCAPKLSTDISNPFVFSPSVWLIEPGGREPTPKGVAPTRDRWFINWTMFGVAGVEGQWRGEVGRA
eukprot:1147777-Prymnesium_polylepis.1